MHPGGQAEGRVNRYRWGVFALLFAIGAIGGLIIVLIDAWMFG